jgi:hypothetical protein
LPRQQECFAQVNYVIIVKWISLVRVLTLNKKKERRAEHWKQMQKSHSRAQLFSVDALGAQNSEPAISLRKKW